MHVIVLGSGTPVPVPGRAGAALAIVADDGEWILVDCGRAATQRAIDAGLDLTALVAVAISHHHSDHLGDLATLATVRWTAGATTPLRVVAPGGPSATFASRCLDAYDDSSFYSQAREESARRPAIEVDAFEPTTQADEVFSSESWTVSSALVDHHPVEPAVGYRVEREGQTVTVSGDTAVCPGMHALASGADVLVHEALLSSAVPASLLEWNASAASVGALAAEARAATLVLTHLIPAPNGEADERAYVDEVRSGGYDGAVLVAHDQLAILLSPADS